MLAIPLGDRFGDIKTPIGDSHFLMDSIIDNRGDAFLNNRD
jgi:hypothetical protein